jgi:membrane protease subunit HflC
MNIKQSVLLITALVVLALLSLSIYTVPEGQRAIVLRLGEIVKNKQTGQARVLTPGVHFKPPFITQVRRFSVKLQTMSEESVRILTKEQKYVIVSYYAKWRIQDLPLFYTRTGGFSRRADLLLQQKINGALRAAFGRRSIKDVISSERLNLMNMLQDKAEESAKNLGIHVVDVRIVGIDLPPTVQESVFKRMRTEREQVATQHRARGRAQQAAIMADADRQVTVMLAKAKANAQALRASGDREAAKIYSQAYDKSPAFYAFYRSLEAYRHVLHRHTMMVISPQSAFFKVFERK